MQETNQEELNLLELFKGLNPENKKNIFIKLRSSLINSYQEQKKEEEENALKAECDRVGHLFSKWENKTWTVHSGPTVIDRQFLDDYTYQKSVWERTCKRCGLVESQTEKPNEIRKKEIKLNLKKLKAELDSLND